MTKIGVIHWNWSDLSFSEFLKSAAESGATHVQLLSADVWPDPTLDASVLELKAAAERVREEVKSHGLKVSAYGASNDFVQPNADAIEWQVARMRRVCEITKIFGDDTVVVSEGGFPKDSVPEEKWWDVMYGCFSRCIPFLDELEVSLAIDNHGYVTNNGDLLADMLQRLDHPRLGSNLDTMNLRWFGYEVAECNRIYELLAPYALHTHLKDGTGSREEYLGAVLGEGEIDLHHAVQCLKKVGYDGVYCAEYEGIETDGSGYRRCVEWIQRQV